MLYKAVLIANKNTIKDYFFSFILNKMKFSTIFIVHIGSESLKSIELNNQFHLHIPFPNGVTNISQFSNEERVEYSKRVTDLITMETGEDNENYFCFFQNFDHSYLFSQIKERTKFKIFSFFNEDILSPDINNLENSDFDTFQYQIRSPDKLIYTSSEVAKFLNKRLGMPKEKLKHWAYGTSNLISHEDRDAFMDNYLGTPRSTRMIVFHGETLSQVKLSLLVDIITLLTKENHHLRIFLAGSFDYDAILKKLSLPAKLSVTFMGRIEELEMQKLSLISTCVIYLDHKAITDSSFLFFLQNNKALITYKNNIPFEYRMHNNFYPISTKTISGPTAAKAISNNILKIINQNVPQVVSNKDAILSNDLRVSCLRKILLPNLEKHLV